MSLDSWSGGLFVLIVGIALGIPIGMVAMRERTERWRERYQAAAALLRQYRARERHGVDLRRKLPGLLRRQAD
jgi:hypothetical protein